MKKNVHVCVLAMVKKAIVPVSPTPKCLWASVYSCMSARFMIPCVCVLYSVHQCVDNSVCVGVLYSVCVCLNACTILLGTGGEESNDTSGTKGTEDIVVCRRHGLEH